jgi:predicted RNase H-like HicB family nuclease
MWQHERRRPDHDHAHRLIEFDEETGLYVGIVPGIPGAHTQAASLDELRATLEEVVELCLEEQADLRERLPKFVGVQQIEIA